MMFIPQQDAVQGTGGGKCVPRTVIMPFKVLQATRSFCLSSASLCTLSGLSLPVALSSRIKIRPNRCDTDSLSQKRVQNSICYPAPNSTSHLHFKRQRTIDRVLTQSLLPVTSSTGCDTFTSPPPVSLMPVAQLSRCIVHSPAKPLNLAQLFRVINTEDVYRLCQADFDPTARFRPHFYSRQRDRGRRTDGFSRLAKLRC